MLLIILSAIFGSPRAILAARVFGALALLCPCAPEDIGCPERHDLASRVIAVVAEDDADAALLLGIGAHESGFRETVRSWWQVEPVGRSRAERAEDTRRLEREPLYAAERALTVARTGMNAYACGDARGCPQAAAELRRYVGRARSILAER